MDKQFRKLLSRYTDKTITDKERKVVDLFFEKLQENGLTKDAAEKDRELKDRLSEAVFNKTVNKSGHRISRYYKIAAVFVIGLLTAASILYLRKPQTVTRIARNGEQLEFYLNDSSLVYLNAGSKLTYPEEFAKDTRTVILEGEAFFKVTHKQRHTPFIVKSINLSTKVLGTRFNVTDYPDETPVVTVQSGKVEVSQLHREDKVELVKDQQAVLDGTSRKLTRQEIAASGYTDWHEGWINFNRADIREVINTLNRTFDTHIVLRSALYRECTISGKFSRDNLPDILESLQFIYGIRYKKQSDDTIDLYTKPCSTP